MEGGRRLREDVLRLQEEREEQELKVQRKVRHAHLAVHTHTHTTHMCAIIPHTTHTHTGYSRAPDAAVSAARD